MPCRARSDHDEIVVLCQLIRVNLHARHDSGAQWRRQQIVTPTNGLPADQSVERAVQAFLKSAGTALSNLSFSPVTG